MHFTVYLKCFCFSEKLPQLATKAAINSLRFNWPVSFGLIISQTDNQLFEAFIIVCGKQWLCLLIYLFIFQTYVQPQTPQIRGGQTFYRPQSVPTSQTQRMTNHRQVIYSFLFRSLIFLTVGVCGDRNYICH